MLELVLTYKKTEVQWGSQHDPFDVQISNRMRYKIRWGWTMSNIDYYSWIDFL